MFLDAQNRLLEGTQLVTGIFVPLDEEAASRYEQEIQR